MKKILVISVMMMLLLTLFISCSKDPIETKVPNTSDATVIYEPDRSPDRWNSYVTDGIHGYRYDFKSKVESYDKGLPDKTVEIFGKTYRLEYDRTIKQQFTTTEKDFYHARNPNGGVILSVMYVSGTDKIVHVSSSGDITFEETMVGKLNTNEEFMAYATEILSRYLDASEYEGELEHDSGAEKYFYFYKLLDGYRTKECVRIFIRNDGALTGIGMEYCGAYDQVKNVRFDKKAIESLAYGNEIESVTIINDDGDIVAELKYWELSHGTCITTAEPEMHLTKKHIRLAVKKAESERTTVKVTTTAPPVTTPGTTELVLTTPPAETLASPLE